MKWLPLAALALLTMLFAAAMLRPSMPVAASRLVGQPMPAVDLPPIVQGRPGIDWSRTKGVRLVNVFASWCAPCAGEMAYLADLRRAGVPLYGVAIRDRAPDLAAFLARHGNPFDAIGSDPQSQAQITLGSAGVPETFVVDAKGVIRFHLTAPIDGGNIDAVRAAIAAASQ